MLTAAEDIAPTLTKFRADLVLGLRASQPLRSILIQRGAVAPVDFEHMFFLFAEIGMWNRRFPAQFISDLDLA